MTAVGVRRFTSQEYYVLERAAEYKSDFYRGEIFARSGGTPRHSKIAVNVGGSLWQRLRGKPCQPYESNLRLRVLATGLRCYPDVSIFCKPFERDEEDPSGETVTNPTVIFEVLSKSTEGYDRGLKANSYRQIESLQAYLLVLQNSASIEMHERQSNGSWAVRDISGVASVAVIASVNVELPLSDIYDRVDFDASE